VIPLPALLAIEKRPPANLNKYLIDPIAPMI
jgi:hypothetical protein